MEQEFQFFKENVDEWVKQIKRELADFSETKGLVNEIAFNTQHNYELVYELKDEIEELKQEINALKLIQIISLKKSQDATIQ